MLQEMGRQARVRWSLGREANARPDDRQESGGRSRDVDACGSAPLVTVNGREAGPCRIGGTLARQSVRSRIPVE